MYDFSADMTDCAQAVELALAERLSIAALSGPGPVAERLVSAMRHGSLEGGKRLRPLLLRQAAAIFNVPMQQALTRRKTRRVLSSRARPPARRG